MFRLEVKSAMPDVDKETRAIGEIAGILGALEEDQRARVIRYVLDIFNIAGTSNDTKAPSRDFQSESSGDTPAEFEDFASLVDAAHPGTDVMKALVAGYWLQVCLGGPSFDAQSANTELKNLGHASSNITTALGSLINQKPALVLQLRKSGNTKQARKVYKVTESGVRKVKEMISGHGGAE
jgi:hypothetical protein